MTTICAEYFYPDRAAVSVIDRRWLFKHRSAPSSFRIWFGDFERRNWPPHWAHSSLRITQSEHETSQGWAVYPDGTPRPNVQTSVIVVGRLYILVFSCPFREILHSPTITRIFFNRLVEISPPTTGYIAWPPFPTLTDRDADYFTGAIFRQLDVVGGAGKF